MVMVDTDFDGDVFHVHEVYWGDDLAACDWTFAARGDGLGQTAMIVFLDVYGNERRVTVDVGALKEEPHTSSESA